MRAAAKAWATQCFADRNDDFVGLVWIVEPVISLEQFVQPFDRRGFAGVLTARSSDTAFASRILALRRGKLSDRQTVRPSDRPTVRPSALRPSDLSGLGEPERVPVLVLDVHLPRPVVLVDRPGIDRDPLRLQLAMESIHVVAENDCGAPFRAVA